MKTIREIERDLEPVLAEAMSAIGQMFIAPSELGKTDMSGKRDIGVYRFSEAAKMFRWCADYIERVSASWCVSDLTETVMRESAQQQNAVDRLRADAASDEVASASGN